MQDEFADAITIGVIGLVMGGTNVHFGVPGWQP